MLIQAVLHLCQAAIAHRPVVGHPPLEPGGVAFVTHVEHQVGAQAVEQGVAVAQVGTNLLFELLDNPWHQLGLQGVLISTFDPLAHLCALIQPRAFIQGRVQWRGKDLGGGVVRVQGLKNCLGIITGAQLPLLLTPLLGQLSQLFKTPVVG